jgi:hypothetical protein
VQNVPKRRNERPGRKRKMRTEPKPRLKLGQPKPKNVLLPNRLNVRRSERRIWRRFVYNNNEKKRPRSVERRELVVRVDYVGRIRQRLVLLGYGGLIHQRVVQLHLSNLLVRQVDGERRKGREHRGRGRPLTARLLLLPMGHPLLLLSSWRERRLLLLDRLRHPRLLKELHLRRRFIKLDKGGEGEVGVPVVVLLEVHPLVEVVRPLHENLHLDGRVETVSSHAYSLGFSQHG